DLGHGRTVGAAGAGQGRQGGDPDRVGLGPQDRGSGDGGDTAQERGAAADASVHHLKSPNSPKTAPASIGCTLPPRKRSRTVGSVASSLAPPSRSTRPWTSTQARVETASASSAFCSTIRIATPVLFSATIVANSSSAARGLRPAVG